MINIKERGAVGDGKTDDTAAIERALAQTGELVFFPTGRYKVSRALNPECPAIVGEHFHTTILAPTSAVRTWALRLDVHTTRLEHISVDGAASPNATGLVLGRAPGGTARFAGMVASVQVYGFSGTTGVGLKVADCIKSLLQYVRIGGNGTNILIRPDTSGYPTTAEFIHCEATNSTVGPGLAIYGGLGLTFVGFISESNAKEAILIDTSVAQEDVLETQFIAAWCEANCVASGTYEVRVVSSSPRACRVAFKGASIAPQKALSLKFDGSGVSFFCENVQVPPAVAGEILSTNGATGSVFVPPNLVPARVIDRASTGLTQTQIK